MRKFINSCVIVLIITSVLKVVHALEELGILGVRDPVFVFLTHRQLIVLTAMLEIAVLLVLLRPFEHTTQLLTICFLSSAFAAYRIAIHLMGYTGPCLCFGGAQGLFGVSEPTVKLLSFLVLGYMLLGSYYFVARDLTGSPQREAS